MIASSDFRDVVFHCLRQFYFGETPPSAFDEWLCTEGASIEAIIGNDAYSELIDFDYSDRDEQELAKRVVQRVYNEKLRGNLVRDRVRDTLEAMLNGTTSLGAGSRVLWDLRLDGAQFIPAVFAGYASELEKPGNESYYKQRILRDAREFLRDLHQQE